MHFKDYYKILGVAPEATQADIKRAYRQLARKYHPDVSSETNAEERFKEVGEAYEALKDPARRKTYDQLRNRGWRQGDEFKPPPDWAGGGVGGGRSGRFSSEDLGGFSDFFSSLFGGFGQSRPRPGARRAGRDLETEIEVDLEVACTGGKQRVTLSTTELGPDGLPKPASKTLEVAIPAGIQSGQKIRLAGKGEPGQNGGPAGHLYLVVKIKTHKLFELHGRDIHLHLPIAPWEAALGAKVTVLTINGKVEMKIPPGSSSGKRLRLSGRGLPGDPPGDQYVILKVVVPAAKTERERELYRELANLQVFDDRQNLI